MASKSKSNTILIFLIISSLAPPSWATTAEPAPAPTPTPWPHQFHSILVMRYNGINQKIDLWYNWPNGRNFNIIQHQLGNVLYDLEWNNGTSFFYTLDSSRECSSAQLEVGVLRPNWLEGANYPDSGVSTGSSATSGRRLISFGTMRMFSPNALFIGSSTLVLHGVFFKCLDTTGISHSIALTFSFHNITAH